MTIAGRLQRVCINLTANRRSPPLASLAAESNPERFLWRILPHAARTFAAAIAPLRDELARPIAVAYLLCRMLDTIEDLAPDDVTRTAGLDALRHAVSIEPPVPGGGSPAAPTAVPTPVRHLPTFAGFLVQDRRDEAHLLLLKRADMVFAVFDRLARPSRARIAALVERMALGMAAAAAIKQQSGGVLPAGAPREAYCRAVLAAPLAFAEAEMSAGLGTEVDAATRAARAAHTDAVGELIQLANICRDVEKDLARGIAYDAALRPFLTPDSGAHGVAPAAAPAAIVAGVRRRILERVGVLSASVAPYFRGMALPRWSGARGGALVMLQATVRFFQRANSRLDPPVLAHAPLAGRLGACWIILRGGFSQRAADRAFTALAAALAPCAHVGLAAPAPTITAP